MIDDGIRKKSLILRIKVKNEVSLRILEKDERLERMGRLRSITEDRKKPNYYSWAF